MNRIWLKSLAKCAVFGSTLGSTPAILPNAFSQEIVGRAITQPAFQPSLSSTPTFLPVAQFQIPFNVDSTGAEPALVQLWVSTDEGATWQIHGNAKPDAKLFNFRAAAEGLYLFSVRTTDSSGASFPSASPPLRVQVDTTKPQAAIRADLNAEGKLVIDVRVVDSFLDSNSATLRIRTDRDANWTEIAVQDLSSIGDIYVGQSIVPISPCREVAVVFAVKDQANNIGEATFRLDMPRTAAGERDMRLASAGLGNPDGNSSFVPQTSIQSIAGATPWEPEQTTNANLRSARAPLGKLAGSDRLTLEPANGVEELPLPPAAVGRSVPVAPGELGALDAPGSMDQRPVVKRFETKAMEDNASAVQPKSEADAASPTIGQAYHCKSRAFSLDYSVDALGGNALADVELWGTEDGGRNWGLWGSDPDRQSPFDVQVGNDGLFGFRMVVVGANGVVSNRPKSGDSSDVWINVDTESPAAKISRAVYGEGPEDGLLVIDYTCGDSHLVDRPISFSFSERLDGPWTTIATGLKDTGIYLWKADPNLPDRIFLKLEVVDKAGNLGTHRLDLPIDIKGLAPRGRIQGFRPIITPQP